MANVYELLGPRGSVLGTLSVNPQVDVGRMRQILAMGRLRVRLIGSGATAKAVVEKEETEPKPKEPQQSKSKRGRWGSHE